MELIELKNVCKSFKIYSDKANTLKERVLHKKRNTYRQHEVLKDISLTIHKGESVGLIGENGCGKSTLLKLMTKIYYPEKGSLQVNGRVSSLIELGAGFHPDLSGRENIYTNASIYGLSKHEIDQRLEEIIEFSELGEFIDSPVRTYSSGMYMRLAFSVAINVNAEILLIDEILAVGDTNFQAKCYKRLNRLKDQNVTIVIVTHDTSVVERFCNRAIWLKDGVIAHEGSPIITVDMYKKYMNDKQMESLRNAEAEADTNESPADEEQNSESQEESEDSNEIDYSANRFGTKEVEILSAYFINNEGKKTNILKGGQKAQLFIEYKKHKQCRGYMFGLAFYSSDNVLLYGNNTNLDGIRLTDIPDRGVFTCEIEALNLLSGDYKLSVAVVDQNETPLDFIRHYSDFTVISDERSIGVMSVDHHWIIPKI